jgi:subfamily B ATP-binding cassette protein MsbA
MGKMTLLDTRMKYVLSFIKKYIWVMVGIIVLQFIQNYVFTMLPKISTNFIFELFTPENFHQIYKYFFIALGIIIVRGVLGYVTTYSLAVYSENAANKLRVNFFNHLINLPLHYFKKNKTGNFITITIDDISKIRTNLYEGIVKIISQSIYAIIVVTKLALLNYKLTLISLVVFPAVYVLLRVLGKKLRRTSKKLQQNVSNLSTNLHETITGVDVVKAFAKEDHETEKFSRTSGDYRKTSLKLKVLNSAFKPLNNFIFYFFGFILIGIAGFFIIQGTWTVKGLSEYLMLLAILFTPVSNIPKTIANFKIVSASVDRVYNVIETVNTITDPPNPVEKDIEGNIRFQNVYFAYDSETVLSGINFTVEKGDILALVGSSGAGKTSVVNLIPRFYDPVSGAVEVDGIDVKNYGIKSLRSQIGIVSQNIVLFNDTILENIRYSNQNASKEEVIEAAKKAHAYEFISRLPEQFETVVGERGTRLSGGEKQRIAIARAVLTNPQILILDEATSSLDSESEHYIQLALNELMKGKTSVVIAHRLSTITHANHILVIEDGQINAQGTHEELLEKNEIYKRLYKLQYFR